MIWRAQTNQKQTLRKLLSLVNPKRRKHFLVAKLSRKICWFHLHWSCHWRQVHKTLHTHTHIITQNHCFLSQKFLSQLEKLIKIISKISKNSKNSSHRRQNQNKKIFFFCKYLKRKEFLFIFFFLSFSFFLFFYFSLSIAQNQKTKKKR